MYDMYDKTTLFQTLRDTVIPLRVAIPLVLFSTALVVGLTSTLYFSHWAERNQERELQKETTALATRLQKRLENLLMQGDRVEVQRNLQALDSDPHVQAAWLADEQDHIVAAMPQSLLGELAAPHYAEYAAPLPPAQVHALLAQVRGTLTGHTRITDDGARLLTFYPVAWPLVAEEPRSPRTGVLFLRSDLTQLKRAAVNFVLGQAAVMTVILFCAAGLIGLYLYLVVTRRIERLVEVSQALGQGDEQTRTQFKGKDELSQFGAAFDVMINTIQARSAQTAVALQNSHQQLLDAITYAPLSIALFDRQMGYLATSQIWMREFGRGYADVIGRSHYAIHPDLPDAWKAIHQRGLAGETLKNDEDLWIQADGTQYWLRWAVAPWRDRHGEIGGIIISTENITERKQAENLLSGEKIILEMMAKDEPLGAILDMIARSIEALSSESLCSVLLLDADGVHVRHGAAPSLPQEYNAAVNGLAIGPKAGSCGTAMYRNEQVIVTDIATDPLWEDYRSLALAHGLRACWSMPIQSVAGRILGSFALYWREPRTPSPADLALVARMAYLSAIAIERKRAEAALLASERKLRLVLDGLGPSLFVGLMTSEGVLIEANQPALAAAGLSADEVLGKPLEETYWLAYSETVQRQLRAAITRARHGESSRFDVQIRIAEGVMMWIDFSLTPIHDAQGRVMFLVPSASVIDERKKTERKLAESEALWRTVIHSEPACVKLIDAQGRLMEMNPAGLAMVEAESRDQVVGHDVKSLVAPDHRDAFEGLYHRVMAGESDSLVFDIVGIKGTHRTLETHAAPLRDASGAVIALLGVTHDVTDRQRTAHALKESEARYRAIFQGAGVSLWEEDFSALQADVMLLRNEHGEGLRDWFDAHPDELLALMRQVSVVDVNRASLDLFGAKTKDELIGGLSRIFVPESLPLFRDELLALASGARGFTAEAEVGTLNNGRLTVLVTLTAVEMVRPWERILVSMLDVTEIRQYRVQLEALVTQRTTQLQAAYKELESFSYSISHDLRAPLRSIAGFGQALKDEYGGQLDDAAQKYLSRIQRGALRMGELIEALLQLSRITRVDIHREPLDLSKMANQVVETLRHGEPQRSVDVNIAPGLTAAGDATLIYSVLENLLSNAWKYSSLTEHARIDFRQELRDAERVFCVADNGAGFDMKYASKLFGAFQRMHTPAEFPGSGIGLATVDRIIRRHGGRIWAEAEVVRGAQFYFTLPPKESA